MGTPDKDEKLWPPIEYWPGTENDNEMQDLAMGFIQWGIVALLIIFIVGFVGFSIATISNWLV